MVYFISGITCDGQYITSSSFRSRILQRSDIKDTGSQFQLPETWDISHLLNLAINDVREGKHEFSESEKFLRRFINQANVFHDEMNRGKGFSTLKVVSAQECLPADTPTTFSTTRYTVDMN